MVGLIAVVRFREFSTSAVTLDLIKSLLEYSKPLKDALDAIDPTIATWTPYPAAFGDNPAVMPAPFKILGHTIDDLSHIGVYHQKYAIIRTATGDHVGYLGGIDINSDRVDTTLTSSEAPLSRRAGASHRACRERPDSLVSGTRRPARRHSLDSFPGAIPAAGNHSGADRSHLLQCGGRKRHHSVFLRANWRVDAGAHDHVRDSQARDFIYIEDQYFTPPEDYIDALREAAARGPARALIITMPFATDQPYGQVRRAEVLAALQTAWGGRLYTGDAFASLPARDSRAYHESWTHVSRQLELSASEAMATFGAYAHLPAPPFWAFIGNELVLVHALAGPPIGQWFQRDAAGGDRARARRSRLGRTTRRPSGRRHLFSRSRCRVSTCTRR